MKLPNWFKVAWWLALCGVITVFLASRYGDLVAGRAVPADIVVFIIWVALLLVPVFQEIEFLASSSVRKSRSSKTRSDPKPPR